MKPNWSLFFLGRKRVRFRSAASESLLCLDWSATHSSVGDISSSRRILTSNRQGGYAVERQWAWADDTPFDIVSLYYPASFAECKKTPGENGCCTPAVDCLFFGDGSKSQPNNLHGKIHCYQNLKLMKWQGSKTAWRFRVLQNCSQALGMTSAVLARCLLFANEQLVW